MKKKFQGRASSLRDCSGGQLGHLGCRVQRCCRVAVSFRGRGREDEEGAIRLMRVLRTYIALLGSVGVSQSCVGTGTARAVFMTSPAGADSISEHSQVISGAGCNSRLDLLSPATCQHSDAAWLDTFPRCYQVIQHIGGSAFPPCRKTSTQQSYPEAVPETWNSTCFQLFTY